MISAKANKNRECAGTLFDQIRSQLIEQLRLQEHPATQEMIYHEYKCAIRLAELLMLRTRGEPAEMCMNTLPLGDSVRR